MKSDLPKIIKADVTREEQGNHVQDLMSEMEQKFDQAYPMTEATDDASLNGEGIENCVMKNLYQDLFRNKTEAEFNAAYVKQTLVHQRFIKPEHLDLPTGKKARIDPVRIEHAI